jgi:hypothetical protein
LAGVCACMLASQTDPPLADYNTCAGERAPKDADALKIRVTVSFDPIQAVPGQDPVWHGQKTPIGQKI